MSEKYYTLKKQKYLELIQECGRSGKPKRQWCRENGIAYSTFMRWQKQLREEAAGHILAQREENSAQIVPLQIQPSAAQTIEALPAGSYASAARQEIRIQKDGLLLILPASTSADYLVSVMRGVL